MSIFLVDGRGGDCRDTLVLVLDWLPWQGRDRRPGGHMAFLRVRVLQGPCTHCFGTEECKCVQSMVWG